MELDSPGDSVAVPGKKRCGECGEEKDPVDGLVRIYGPPRPEGSTRKVCPGCIPDVVPWLFSFMEGVEIVCAFCDSPIQYFLRTPGGIMPHCYHCVEHDTQRALDHLIGSLEATLNISVSP